MHNESILFAIVIHYTEGKEVFQIFVIDLRQTYCWFKFGCLVLLQCYNVHAQQEPYIAMWH